MHQIWVINRSNFVDQAHTTMVTLLKSINHYDIIHISFQSWLWECSSNFNHKISLHSRPSVNPPYCHTKSTHVPNKSAFTLSVPDKSWWCMQGTRGFWSERRWSLQTLLCWMKGWSYRRDQHTHLYYTTWLFEFDVENCKHVKLLNACKSRVNSKE